MESPHLVLISFFRFRHFFIMSDLVFIMSDLVLISFYIKCCKPTSFLESPHLVLISFCRRNQHFHKPCLTPHLVFIIVNKCSCSYVPSCHLKSKLSSKWVNIFPQKIGVNIKNIHPGRLTAGTYKSPNQKEKSSEPNLQGIMCKMFIFQGVYLSYHHL